MGIYGNLFRKLEIGGSSNIKIVQRIEFILCTVPVHVCLGVVGEDSTAATYISIHTDHRHESGSSIVALYNERYTERKKT